MASLVEPESDVRPLDFTAKAEATYVNGHHAIYLPLPEQRQTLPLKVDVDTMINTELYRFKNFPDGSATPGHFAEQDNAYLVCRRVFQTCGQYSPILVGRRSAYVFLVNTLNLVSFGRGQFSKRLNLSLRGLAVSGGTNSGVDVTTGHNNQSFFGLHFPVRI